MTRSTSVFLLCVGLCMIHGLVQVISSESALREHLLDGHDIHMPPDMKRKPTQITFSSHLSSLYAIDQRRGTFDADIFIRAHWMDRRFSYEGLTLNLSYSLPCLDLHMVETWKPDFYMRNAVVAAHKPQETMFYAEPDGAMTWSRRFIVTCRCAMNFRNFPFDVQECGIVLEAYRTRADIAFFTFIEYGDTDGGFDKAWSSEWYGFKQKLSTAVLSYSTGDFPHALISFEMRRRPDSWITGAVIPGNVFVCMSYSGYFIDKYAMPARVSLAITTILITITLMANVIATKPIVTYSVWLRDYLSGCLFFNILAGGTYVLSCYRLKALKEDKAMDDKGTPIAQEAIAQEATAQPAEQRQHYGMSISISDSMLRLRRWNVRLGHHSPSLDWHMIWVFPLLFIVYNIVMFGLIGRGPYNQDADQAQYNAQPSIVADGN